MSSDDVQTRREHSSDRGGRFAKSNVKHSSRSGSSKGRFSSDRKENNEQEAGSKGLIAVVIILLLAIIMVVVYIGVKVFFPELQENVDQSGNQTTTAPLNHGGQSIPCTDIRLSVLTVEFKEANSSQLLSVEKTPENTTDAVVYKSEDPSVAAVDAEGNVTPVGYGITTITVTCGNVTKSCTVVSNVGEPPTTVPPTNPPVTLPDGFKLVLETYKYSGEITISSEGGSHKLYKEIMGVKAEDISWTTSDPAVATVENGKVVGVDRGTCTITATIGNQTATCLVRCPFDAAEPTPYKLSQGSATIAKGETFSLYLQEIETGANIQNIEWQVSAEGIVSINGNKITGGTVSKLTSVDVYVEYEGTKYVCKVYVKAPEA